MDIHANDKQLFSALPNKKELGLLGISFNILRITDT